jgi:hypothetical protein
MTEVHERRHQGDQIGRIFAKWVIAYFRQLLENNRNSLHFAVLCFTAKFMH